jgi:hypothetical protein
LGTIVVVTIRVHLHHNSTERKHRLSVDMGLLSCGISMARIIRARILSVLGRECMHSVLVPLIRACTHTVRPFRAIPLPIFLTLLLHSKRYSLIVIFFFFFFILFVLPRAHNFSASQHFLLCRDGTPTKVRHAESSCAGLENCDRATGPLYCAATT